MTSIENENINPVETISKKIDLKIIKSEKKVPLKIDFDFTKMNYNIASGILFDMIVESENYENKNVKITTQMSSLKKRSLVYKITPQLSMKIL